MGNPELLEDIQLLFTIPSSALGECALPCGSPMRAALPYRTSELRKLFTNFPHVVKAVRHLADRFVAFVQGHLAA